VISSIGLGGLLSGLLELPDFLILDDPGLPLCLLDPFKLLKLVFELYFLSYSTD
jgi:hypothetical protein